MTRRIRLADVARHAGVSPTTASFVLAGRTDMRISDEAQRRVRTAAAELGYRPNLTARSLRTSVTRTVGLVSDTVAADPYAGGMVRGAISAATDRHHLLLIAESEGDADLERRLIDEMLDRQVDGLLYASMFTRAVAVPETLRRSALVLLNCVSEGDPVCAVVPDERAAGRAAATELLDAGHRDGIHLVGEPAPEVYAGRERVAGIEEALGSAGAALAGVIDCPWQPQPACEAVAAFLAAGGAPKAFICLNDRVALGAYQALRDAGVRIPADVSVVSFDDSDLAAWTRPPLTSIALPHEDMGRAAVVLLLDGVDAPVVHRVPMPVRRRDSVAPPTGA
jgi:LacI family transcriptional regulator